MAWIVRVLPDCRGVWLLVHMILQYVVFLTTSQRPSYGGAGFMVAMQLAGWIIFMLRGPIFSGE